MTEWLAVGVHGDSVTETSVKVFGPFDDPDDARAFCNDLGLVSIRWAVVPMRGTTPFPLD